MPSFTLGSTITAILQFIAVMIILTVVLNTHTTGGAGIIPVNEMVHLNGIINTTNQTYVSSNSALSLTVQMGNEFNQSANSLGSTGGILQTVGGLAFIPSAFGAFMSTLINIPGTIIAVINAVLSMNSPYVLLPFSAMSLSAILMAYYVIEFIFKSFTPITKTEISDI